MTTPLLDIDEFRTRTVMPATDVERLEEDAQGFIEARIAVWTARIYAQLAKRYAVPFADPPPEIAVAWCVSCVTADAYRKRGFNPADEQAADIDQDRKDALDEIQLAADAENGLFDLPLRDDTNASGISKGGPFGYSEQSPYAWLDAQVLEAKEEDSNGRR